MTIIHHILLVTLQVNQPSNYTYPCTTNVCIIIHISSSLLPLLKGIVSFAWTESFDFHLTLIDIGQDWEYIPSTMSTFDNEKLSIYSSVSNANMFIDSSHEFYSHCEISKVCNLSLQNEFTFNIYGYTLFDISVESINTISNISNKRYLFFFLLVLSDCTVFYQIPFYYMLMKRFKRMIDIKYECNNKQYIGSINIHLDHLL